VPVDTGPALRRDVPAGSSAPPEPGLRERVEQLEARVQRLETALADLLGDVPDDDRATGTDDDGDPVG